MNKIKSGDTVTLHFTGRLSDGKIFDTTREKSPIKLKIGNGIFLKTFENALIGMRKGESKKIKIKCADAYGLENKELIFDIDKKIFPESIELRPGLELEFKQDNGKILRTLIVEINDDKVIVNTNHPLSGKDLYFDIEIVDI